MATHAPPAYLGRSERQGIWPLVARAFGALPWSWLAAIGALLGWLAGSVLRIRRAHVEQAMRTAGITRASHHAGRMYRSLGASACELLWLSAGRRDLDAVATIEAASAVRLDAVLASGRGAIVAASHTGNWDLAACAVAQRAPLLVITKRLSAVSLDAFWQGARAAYGVLLAPATGATRRVPEVLARGGLVAMMIDQVPVSRRHAVVDDFLGAEAHLDRAPAALALRAEVPLVVTAARRTADGGQELHILDVIEPPPAGAPSDGAPARSAWIDDATRAANRALAAFVRENPSEWLWLHRRWKAPPVDARARVK